MLFEIVTMNKTQYPPIDNKDLVTCVKSSYWMEKPYNCADLMHEIMQRCWHEEQLQRPTSFELRE